jgi:hypothetical protein
MKINVQLMLGPCRPLKLVRELNSTIFEKIYELELSPSIFNAIVKKRLRISDQTFKDQLGYVVAYNDKTNVLEVDADMRSATQSYMDLLKNSGWTFHEDAAKLHGLPITEEIEAECEKSSVH